MKTFLPILFLILLFSGISCTATHPCHYFPKAFKTVEEAEHRLNTPECEALVDSVSFRQGQLRHAAFYSCDKKMGYLLLRFSDRKQVYRNIPQQYWRNMRKAKSFESYFRLNVEHRFPVYLETKIPGTAAL